MAGIANAASPVAVVELERTLSRPEECDRSLLGSPERADVNVLHDGVLFNYNMFAYLDGEFLEKAVAFAQNGGNPKEIRNSGIRPDMMKRGAVRSVYDGRHTFARYFSPKQHNKPTTLEDLLKYNDVEIFDLQSDPGEMRNLAMGGSQHREIVIAMDDKLNRSIEAEVGEDRGQMLPGGIEAGWEVTAETMAGA